MSDTICNHTSVGMIIIRENKLLLIERKKFPIGFAPPAGHVDMGETYQEAASRELVEEVGLEAVSISSLFKGRLENPCRRVDGTYHEWEVYLIDTQGEVISNTEETKSHRWVTKEELGVLIVRTKEYESGSIDDESWSQHPGIEKVWVTILDKTLPHTTDIFK